MESSSKLSSTGTEALKFAAVRTFPPPPLAFIGQFLNGTAKRGSKQGVRAPKLGANICIHGIKPVNRLGTGIISSYDVYLHRFLGKWGGNCVNRGLKTRKNGCGGRCLPLVPPNLSRSRRISVGGHRSAVSMRPGTLICVISSKQLTKYIHKRWYFTCLASL